MLKGQPQSGSPGAPRAKELSSTGPEGHTAWLREEGQQRGFLAVGAGGDPPHPVTHLPLFKCQEEGKEV